MKSSSASSRLEGCPNSGTHVIRILGTFLAIMVLTSEAARTRPHKHRPPELIPGTEVVTAREGGKAVLPCSVRHLGTKTVAWRRVRSDTFLTVGATTWQSDAHFSLQHTKAHGAHGISRWDLVIESVRKDDSGVYECQVTTQKGNFLRVMLNVHGPPVPKQASRNRSNSGRGDPLQRNSPITKCGTQDLGGSCLISITGKKYVDVNQRFQLICNATGGLRIPDEIDWFKEGDKIDPRKYPRIYVHKDQKMDSMVSTLTIERSREKDSGNYICRSSRNDIANLAVTVLHDDKNQGKGRRETDTDKSAQKAPGAGTSAQRGASSLAQFLVVFLGLVISTFLRCHLS